MAFATDFKGASQYSIVNSDSLAQQVSLYASFL